MLINAIRFSVIVLLILPVSHMARALTFGDLAVGSDGQGESDSQAGGNTHDAEPQNTYRGGGFQQYSCPMPAAEEADVPQYNLRPEYRGRNDSMPQPRYDPYIDPYNPRPYYGYGSTYAEPGWSQRQSQEWWFRHRGY